MIDNYHSIMNEVWIPRSSLTFKVTLGGSDDCSHLMCAPQARDATVIQVMLDYDAIYTLK